MQHGRVVGFVDGAKSGSECAHARVAIDLQIKNLDRKRVTGLRTLNEKWSRQRIVAFDHAERVTRFPEHIPEAVQRVGIQNVARLQPRHRFGGREQILHVVDGGGVVDDVAGLTLSCLGVRNGRPRLSRPSKARRPPVSQRESTRKSKSPTSFDSHQNEYFNENCTSRGVPLVWVSSPTALAPLELTAPTFSFPVNIGFANDG